MTTNGKPSQLPAPTTTNATTAAPLSRSSGWTPQAVRELGLTTDVATAGAILGIGRSKAYELAKAGDFPITIVRIGRRYLVPTSAFLSLLGA